MYWVSSGLEVRSAALRRVLDLLQAYPHKSVVKAMRENMTHEELIFLMKILRIELIDGGWTQRYIDIGEDQLAKDGLRNGAITDGTLAPSDSALGSVSVLMACAIDAIGLSGWLVGQSSDRLGASELIHGLKVEVSAAIEGLYSAELFAAYLDAMAGCEKSLKEAKTVLDPVKGNKNEDGNWTKLLGLASEEEEKAVLPMGGKVEVPAIMGSKDGKLSKRALAQERRAMVGRYEVERIRV
jgi:hypothetical protein